VLDTADIVRDGDITITIVQGAVPEKLAGRHDVSVLDQTGWIRVGSITSIVRHMPDETMNL
jgi:hypothetical protein